MALSKATSSSYTSSKTGASLSGAFYYKSTSSSSFFSSKIVCDGFSVISSSNGFSETGAATSYSLSLIITSV